MRDEAVAAIEAATDLDALKAVRLAHAGDRSPLSLANREIGALPPQARKEAGQRIGQARGAVNQALTRRTEELEAEHEERMLADESVDVTLPYDRDPKGRPAPADHPAWSGSTTSSSAMGWEVAEGPEVEAEWLNFDALNMRRGPPGPHRCRTRSSSSPRTPASCCAPTPRRSRRAACSPATCPIYVICPGRTYRTDELDATHTPVFHQVEGLAVDKGLTMAHLKGTLDHFASAMFGDGITTRFRPSYFPFTEPSVEVDLICFVCRGIEPDVESCRTCRGEGWIEWGGCGVVNPRVLVACGIDPEVYSGFAFGMGDRAHADVPSRRRGHARHGRGRCPLHACLSEWRSECASPSRGCATTSTCRPT